jgi:hypothetical protein
MSVYNNVVGVLTSTEVSSEWYHISSVIFATLCNASTAFDGFTIKLIAFRNKNVLYNKQLFNRSFKNQSHLQQLSYTYHPRPLMGTKRRIWKTYFLKNSMKFFAIPEAMNQCMVQSFLVVLQQHF